jgi:hypothetical protein
VQQIGQRHTVDHCNATLRAREFRVWKFNQGKHLGDTCLEARGGVLWSSTVGVHVATALNHKTYADLPTARPRVSASPFSIAILGTDAFLAAAPALPVQLMHAALAAGFDAVVPASLGDELVASETLRLAQLHGRRPVVQCSCPFSLTQLCKREANLADVTVAVAPAVVALARALRMERTDVLHITYIGMCPGAQDPAIDLQVSPAAFLRGLQQKGIPISTQPDAFADRLPPDRRRFVSLPGGAPRPDVIQSLLRRDAVALDGHTNPLLAVADALFDGGVTMIDPAGAYQCACTGANAEQTAAEGRAAMERLEPPRSAAPIFDAPPWLDLRPTEHASTVAPSDELDARRATVAFSDAAGIDLTPAATSDLSSSATQNDSARRIYGIGVRTARRRAPLIAPVDTELSRSELSESVTSLLRAQPIEREVPLPEQHRDTPADSLASQTLPPSPRRPVTDDLFRRD